MELPKRSSFALITTFTKEVPVPPATKIILQQPTTQNHHKSPCSWLQAYNNCHHYYCPFHFSYNVSTNTTSSTSVDGVGWK